VKDDEYVPRYWLPDTRSPYPVNTCPPETPVTQFHKIPQGLSVPPHPVGISAAKKTPLASLIVHVSVTVSPSVGAEVDHETLEKTGPSQSPASISGHTTGAEVVVVVVVVAGA
jgi:hypothetical protein